MGMFRRCMGWWLWTRGNLPYRTLILGCKKFTSFIHFGERLILIASGKAVIHSTNQSGYSNWKIICYLLHFDISLPEVGRLKGNLMMGTRMQFSALAFTALDVDILLVLDSVGYSGMCLKDGIVCCELGHGVQLTGMCWERYILTGTFLAPVHSPFGI
jgi:hypothetical protein